MLRKPYHGWRIKPEIQKLTAIPTLSPRLPLPPLFFYCHCQTQNLPPPTSHFLFTNQTTKSPLSTSSLATGPSAAAAAAATAAYYSPAPEPNPNTHFEDPNLNVDSLRESYDDSPAPEPNPNTHFEDPNLNVESLRESHDEGREDDGEGFGTLPDKRSLLFTCVSEDGTCKVYVVPTKHSSQELCGEYVEVVTYVQRQVVASRLYPAYASMLEWLKRNPKVVNIREVYPGDDFSVACEELKKYGGKGDLSEQVANMHEVYLGRGFRLAYEKAMQYGIGVMMHHFPIQGIMLEGPWKQQANPSRFSRLWRICLLHLLEWIQSGIFFGRKKMRQFRQISFGDGQHRHKR